MKGVLGKILEEERGAGQDTGGEKRYWVTLEEEKGAGQDWRRKGVLGKMLQEESGTR